MAKETREEHSEERRSPPNHRLAECCENCRFRRGREMYYGLWRHYCLKHKCNVMWSEVCDDFEPDISHKEFFHGVEDKESAKKTCKRLLRRSWWV